MKILSLLLLFCPAFGFAEDFDLSEGKYTSETGMYLRAPEEDCKEGFEKQALPPAYNICVPVTASSEQFILITAAMYELSSGVVVADRYYGSEMAQQEGFIVEVKSKLGNVVVFEGGGRIKLPEEFHGYINSNDEGILYKADSDLTQDWRFCSDGSDIEVEILERVEKNIYSEEVTMRSFEIENHKVCSRWR